MGRDSQRTSSNPVASKLHRAEAHWAMNTFKTRNLLNTTLSAYVTLAGSGRRFQSHIENNVLSLPLKGYKSLPKSKIKTA